MNPKVTVVIPSLNVKDYIGECLDSVTGQTLQEIEIFVVDAYSTDGTRKIIDEYGKKDNRITLLDDREKSTGYSKNLGIDRASAPYYAIVESDDYIEPDMLEKLYVKAEEDGADIVKCGFDTFVGDGEKRFFFPKSVADSVGDYERTIKPSEEIRAFRFTMYEWLGLYRTSFLRERNIRHNESKGAAFQDIGFWFLSMARAEKILLIRDIGYHYRFDNPNASVKNPGKVFNTCDEYEYIRQKLAQEENLWNKVEPAYYREYFHSNAAAYRSLSDELKPLLSLRMHTDLKSADKNGHLDKNIFDEKERRCLDVLVSDSVEYDRMCKQCSMEQKGRLYSLVKKLETASGCVIYGAGYYGSNLQYILKNERIEIDAYVDSDVKKQGERLNGVPILSPADGCKKYAGAYWLVANKWHGMEILKELKIRYNIKEEHIHICDVEALAEVMV